MGEEKVSLSNAELMLKIHDDVQTILRESRQYYKQGLEAVDSIEGMAEAVKMMAGTYLQLEQLPTIFADLSAGIKGLNAGVKEVREQLIAPATGNNRMDTKAVYMIIALSAFMILLLGTIIIVDHVTGKDIAVSAETAMGSVKVQGQEHPLGAKP